MPHELRTDVLTGRQTIIAPIRSERPLAYVPDPPLTRGVDPFAEGRESETPAERFAVRHSESQPDQPGWLLRVVPNRYPLVSMESAKPANDGKFSALFPIQQVRGEHDVVIECPDDRGRLLDLTFDETVRLLAAWRTRIGLLKAAQTFATVVVFRNEGFSAGASLNHCHSQIVGLEHPTPADVIRFGREAEHAHATGRSLLSDLMSAEARDASRIVANTSTLMTFCPFASRTSWHVRFVPVMPESCFGNASEAMLTELSDTLRTVLRAIETVLGGAFSFNLLLVHPRLDQPSTGRWTLDLLPRTGRIAGWELMTDIDIVSVAPEIAAERLRRWSAPARRSTPS